MIWYFILGGVLLLAVILILSCLWEVETSSKYIYDALSSSKTYAYNLEEYKNNPDVVLQLLSEAYPDDYKEYETRFKESSTLSKKKKILSQMNCYELPYKVVCKKRLSFDICWGEHYRVIGGFVIAGFTIITLLIMGGNHICAKVSWSVDSKLTGYEQRVTTLEKNQQALLKFYETGVTKDIDISSSGLPEKIREHNSEVESLVKEIKVDRINLRNPWMNIWINPACEKVDLPRVEATYIELM